MAWSLTNPMWATAMREVLEMLQGIEGDKADVIRMEAELKLALFLAWSSGEQPPPGDDQRQTLVREVSMLYKDAQVLVKQRAEAARLAVEARESAPSHPGV